MNFIYDWFKEIFGGQDMFKEIYEILSMNPSIKNNNIDFSVVWTFIEDIYNRVFVPLGVGLLVIYFLIQIEQKIASERFDYEQLFLLCAKFVATWFFLSYGFKEIIIRILEFGFASLNDVYKSAASQNLNLTPLWQSLIGDSNAKFDINSIDKTTMPGFIDSIGIAFKMILPYMLMYLAKLVIKLICYARLIEMYVRIAVAPVAFADFFSEGLNGTGWRYLKKLFAISFQCVIILITGYIYQKMIAGIGGTSFTSVVALTIIYTFSAVAILVQSKSIANDVFGTN